MLIWILLIEHEHGINYSAHKTEDGARAELDRFARAWWHQISDAPYGGAEAYFDVQADNAESYILESVYLLD